jgi:hypothetical protein
VHFSRAGAITGVIARDALTYSPITAIAFISIK